MNQKKFDERRKRAAKIVSYLKKTYPVPKTELVYDTDFQLLSAVILSAQCTDKKVNAVADKLWKKYKTVADFARMDREVFEREISGITYYRSKARYIQESAQLVVANFDGKVPKTEKELITLPGVAYKTAHVVLNELFNISEGIPTDTHVRRFALRFDLVDNTVLSKISKELEALIPKKDWKYVNNGLVLYGRYVCNAIPHDCSKHPLTKLWPKAGMIWPKAK
ncbi:MAG: endonuclease III [Patescibacteria group bacterium]